MGKALFWDFDGTLVYPDESFLKALYGSLAKYKYEIDVGTIRRHLHAVCSWYTPEISYAGKTGQEWWNTFYKNLDSFYESHRVAKEDTEKINALMKSQILNFKNCTLYADTESVLCQCAELGYKNYILSNNFPALPLVIQGLQLSQYFTDYIVSSNIGYEKPRTELFEYALRTANYPDYCYMIGDNPVADIQGGKSVGMKTILVHKDHIYNADYMCEHLSDIPKLLTR